MWTYLADFGWKATQINGGVRKTNCNLSLSCGFYCYLNKLHTFYARLYVCLHYCTEIFLDRIQYTIFLWIRNLYRSLYRLYYIKHPDEDQHVFQRKWKNNLSIYNINNFFMGSAFVIVLSQKSGSNVVFLMR